MKTLLNPHLSPRSAGRAYPGRRVAAAFTHLATLLQKVPIGQRMDPPRSGRRRPIVHLLAAAAVTALFPLTSISQVYPNKPVKVIVPYPPGGGTDVVARAMANQLSTQTKDTFFVENRAGADGILGTTLAAQSPSDGYSLLTVSGVPFVLNQIVYSKLRYNIVDDFEPISLFASGPLVLLVNSSVPVDNAQDFIKWLKANPGTINYAGADQFTYLGMEMILAATGTKMTHIPYKGTGPALNDVVGGHVSVMLSSLAPAVPFIQSKRVKALAVTSKERSSILPDVPTVAETIVPGYEVPAWYGLLAPKGTPKAIVNRLSEAVNKAVDTPEIRKNVTALGAEVVKSSPAEFRLFLQNELKKWRVVARTTNLPIQ